MDFLVIGCGLAGMTAARILAENGYHILIVERRDHIGGNIYDCHNQDGILIHQYGPHIFHTNNAEVWDFLSRFTSWRNYRHKVLAYVNGSYYPLPINVNTINQLYHEQYDSNTIKAFFNGVKGNLHEIKNAKEAVVSQVGEELYQLFFEGYTKKQWGMPAQELDAEVTARIPVRYNTDNRYFLDQYQGIPLNGYTKMAENMLRHPNISVVLHTDYKDIKNSCGKAQIICTGCIDEFYEQKYGKLPYRSLNFVQETYHKTYCQPAGVINYPNDFPFTRTTEYKYLTGQVSEKTTVVKEFPSAVGEPYYPIPQEANRKLYDKYKEKTLTDHVAFLGRLGTYRYLNMDAVVEQAMKFCKQYMTEERTGRFYESNRNRDLQLQ